MNFVVTPTFCPSIYLFIIFIFKHRLLNWCFILETSVDIISVDKRQDTLIVIAGLFILVHKPDL